MDLMSHKIGEAVFRDQYLGTATMYKEFEDGEEAGVIELMFTYAIVSGLSGFGYEDRWCYHSQDAAEKALTEWDGEYGTEPEGWHRHPSTGRRRVNADPQQESINW